jgi:tetratricopeptide (TPR) repeat protein
MANSSRGRGDHKPAAVVLPGLGGAGRSSGLGDSAPRAKPVAVDLESFLAKGLAAAPKAHGPSVPGSESVARKSTKISPAVVRQAQRCVSEGVRLMTLKRPVEAITWFQQSVTLNPGVATSHHDLGVALLSVGRLELAVQAFAAAIRVDSRLATAHHNLGCIFHLLGLEDKAIASFQAAVALKPDLAAAQLRLGGLYQARGLGVEAAAAFRAAAAASPGTLTAGIAKARAADASGALDEAVAVMRTVVEAYPENAEAHATLGQLLSESGLSAEAATRLDRATELAPEMVGAWSSLVTNKKFTADDDPLIARMNAALALPHLTPRHRQVLHFALGKAHDDMGNYEAAMRDFELGNRLRALSGDLNRDALARHVDQLIEATPPGYRDRQPDPGVEDATPILIVGMPRSGSTLTEQILSSHPEIAARGELEFWGVRDTPQRNIWSIVSTLEAARRLADDYLAALRAHEPCAKRVTDKSLSNFMRLGLLHRVFPNAILIHCRRHPIDTALSIFTTNFEAAKFAYMSRRGDLVFYYRQYQRLMAHWRQVLPPDRFVEVDYEALVTEPEPHVRRLVSVCGLEWNDACLAPHRNPRRITTASVWQARQPIYRTSVERWRRYEPWLGELRELAPEG